MGVPEFPEFGWSLRRSRLEEACPMRLYLATYGSWNGWTAASGTLPFLAWRLGKLIPSWSLLVGILVHDAMKKIGEAVRDSRPRPDYESLWQVGVAELRRVRDVRRADFIRAPKRNPMMADAFWKTRSVRDLGDDCAEAESRLIRCIEVGYDHAVWEDVERSPRVRQPDSIESIQTSVLGDPGHFTFWGAPDLVWVGEDRSTVEILDWKTSRELDVEGGAFQLHVYAAWLVLGGARWSPYWRGRLVSLYDGTTAYVPITEVGLHRVYATIERDVRSWRTRQVERAPNVAMAQSFPRTEDRRECSRCAWRAACEQLSNTGGRIGFPEP